MPSIENEKYAVWGYDSLPFLRQDKFLSSYPIIAYTYAFIPNAVSNETEYTCYAELKPGWRSEKLGLGFKQAYLGHQRSYISSEDFKVSLGDKILVMGSQLVPYLRELDILSYWTDVLSWYPTIDGDFITKAHVNEITSLYYGFIKKLFYHFGVHKIPLDPSNSKTKAFFTCLFSTENVNTELTLFIYFMRDFTYKLDFNLWESYLRNTYDFESNHLYEKILVLAKHSIQAGEISPTTLDQLNLSPHIKG